MCSTGFSVSAFLDGLRRLYPPSYVSSIRVKGCDGVTKVPGRDTAPGPLRLHLHPDTLGTQVHGVRNVQHTLVDHRFYTDGRVWADSDNESGSIIISVLGRLAPGPGVGARGSFREPALGDHRGANCKGCR